MTVAAAWLLLCALGVHAQSDESDPMDNNPMVEQGGRGLLISKMVTKWDKECFWKKCRHMLNTCEADDPDCNKRMHCLGKNGHHCLDGVHLLDLSKDETAAFGCGEKQRCVMLDDSDMHMLRAKAAAMKKMEESEKTHAEKEGKKTHVDKEMTKGAKGHRHHGQKKHKMSLLQYDHDDSDDAAVMGRDMPDYKGLADAKRELKEFDEQERKANAAMKAAKRSTDSNDDASSFLQREDNLRTH